MAVGVSPGELRELTDDELTERLRESKEELFNLRFQMATGQLNNNRRLRTVRQEIARVYTVLRERELGLASGPSRNIVTSRTSARTKPACSRAAVMTGKSARRTSKSMSRVLRTAPSSTVVTHEATAWPPATA